ncbi:PRC-barrel domain-containing protein [Streptomyces prasinopilosus]|uniref:PRC-barrel domain-containing protein n=2 Tax=Streptomyces prasinopilosus TaxID=67344 RepID=UPI0006EB8778|nr:PRC-barrel domain-containing protein [Streptomyces prasinopilosus]
MPTDSIWSYAPELGPAQGQDPDLTGYTVVASDGSTIGHVDRQADPHAMRHLVVDTGVWVFGRSLLVPVGVVAAVDTGERKITVSCTRPEVKAAPRFRTDSETLDPGYLTTVGDYYWALTRPGPPPGAAPGTPAG